MRTLVRNMFMTSVARSHPSSLYHPYSELSHFIYFKMSQQIDDLQAHYILGNCNCTINYLMHEFPHHQYFSATIIALPIAAKCFLPQAIFAYSFGRKSKRPVIPLDSTTKNNISSLASSQRIAQSGLYIPSGISILSNPSPSCFY